MSEELLVAVKAAKEAGKIIMKSFRKSKVVGKKTRRDIVTTADLKADKAITKIISRHFHSHDFLTEETARQEKSSAYCWIIDPIDGTAPYAAGLAEFGISIALAYNGKPVVGVVFKPFFKELFSAEKGKGAFLNGERISVGKENSLENSFIGGDWGHNEGQKFFGILEKLLPLVRYIQMSGSAVNGLTNVACGRMQAYVHNDIKPWDIAASFVIIKEAGGKLTNFEGKEWEINDKEVVASNGLLNEKILEALK